jgi:predicted phosphoribosyltransferase
MRDLQLAGTFDDREDAGRRLAGALAVRLNDEVVVLGLPRGGAIVAGAFARALGNRLDVYVVRKLRAPSNPEFAIGAVAEDGSPYLDRALVDSMNVSEEYLAREEASQRTEIRRQMSVYRGTRPLVPVKGLAVAIVDDGIATGSTVQAAVLGVRTHDPARIIVVTPVASPAAIARLRTQADEVLTILAPADFWAVGEYYHRFDQVADDEVASMLQAADEPWPGG